MSSSSPKRRPLSGFQRVLGAFMPREEDFFVLFQQLSDIGLSAVETLKLVTDDYSKLDYALGKVDELEHEGDELVHEIVHKLNTTFVTPTLLDREDIYRMAERLDDITDHMKGVIDRFRTYDVAAPTPHCERMADLLVQAGRLLRDNMHVLSSMQPGDNPYCAAINELENQGDHILKEALGALFRDTADARDIIKWKDIYEMMEEALDMCEDAANLVESVVVKNA
ncbi:MAG: DUF47 family protein [Armatimonadetes bacterium]|nr:DUF47 family protein [Armatimonadota bacterium]